MNCFFPRNDSGNSAAPTSIPSPRTESHHRKAPQRTTNQNWKENPKTHAVQLISSTGRWYGALTGDASSGPPLRTRDDTAKRKSTTKNPTTARATWRRPNLLSLRYLGLAANMLLQNKNRSLWMVAIFKCFFSFIVSTRVDSEVKLLFTKRNCWVVKGKPSHKRRKQSKKISSFRPIRLVDFPLIEFVQHKQEPDCSSVTLRWG